MIDHFPIPWNGKPERRHLLRWIKEEMVYSHNKYFSGRIGNRGEPINERSKQDSSFDVGLDEYWRPYVSQYLDRALLYHSEALTCDSEEQRRELILKAMQQMGKCVMTAMAMCESAIRVYGSLPKPGVSSSDPIQPWVDPFFEAATGEKQ